MNNKLPFGPGSLLFAPMEGVTDGLYREVIFNNFPDWAYFYCDFLRVPSSGNFSKSKIIKHFGANTFNSPRQRSKTGFQILASPKSNLDFFLNQIIDLDFNLLDLNLGCPSKKVNAHKGGAYLLSDLDLLKGMIQKIRKSHKSIFTVKIRTGFRNTENFDEMIKMFEGEGVDAITIHGRTRDQLYKGVANWSFIKRAVEISNIPIIGNGDIWNTHDIQKMFKETGCYAVMAARGALKTPWLAETFEEYKNKNHMINDDLISIQRRKNLLLYFSELERVYLNNDFPKDKLLKRFKSLSHYCFDELDSEKIIKSKVLRSQSYEAFKDILKSI